MLLCYIQSTSIIIMLIDSKSLLFIFVVLLLIKPFETISTNTQIIQLITPFDMPTNDLKLAVQKQLSRNDFLTSSFNSNRVDVSKLVYKATYNGEGRIVDPPQQSYMHNVSRDSIDVTVTYHAVVHPKLTPKASYDGTTTLRIFLNYSKQIDLQTGLIKITNLKTVVDPASFRMNYSKKPSPSDKQHLDYINNASMEETSDTTIYSLLQTQQFSSAITLKYFNQNIVNQKLSPTYDSVYQYQYNNLNVTFNMATQKIQNIQHGVANYMRGSIQNYNSPPKSQHKSLMEWKVDQDFHTLITIGFIKNFISYNIEQNQDWKGYKVNRKSFFSREFAFRLVDLEFIVNDFSNKYSQYYLNDILFTCNPLSIKSLAANEKANRFNLDLSWTCKCGIVGVTPSPTVLDFDVTFSHEISVGFNGNKLLILIQESKLKDWLFREVDGISVVDEQIAGLHLTEYARNLRGYTVGTYFKVREGSNNVEFDIDNGLWIG